ncbi:peptidase domain-containing ABC transporter [Anaerococcus hydrogenalis]|uniref:peptidase domain-containing ABC transporter n=1 Tax=Anaerococcus hydrogenalis TaxID=33029 RepID=UPI002903763A|nr:peptidase domain-containing ABC transporter [Anaerococcus hydrogenalis]MDU1316834.1 peptidase domain-containing ABC transporter [Anaerococcus hydrogenalis]
MLGFRSKLGFNISAFSDEKKQLDSNLINYPFIAHVILHGFNHFVVVYKIEDNLVTILDPAEGLVEYSLDEFRDFFTGVLFILKPNEDFYKYSNDKNHLKKIISYVKLEKKQFIKIFLNSLIYSLLGIVSSFFFRFLFDEIIPQSNEKRLAYVVLSFLFITIIQIIVQYVRLNSINIFEKNISQSVVLENINKIVHLPLSFFTKYQSGDLIQRLDDSQSISNLLSNTSSSLIVDLIFGIVSGIALFILSKILFCIAFIIFILSMLISLLFVKPLRKTFNDYKKEEGKLKSIYVESLKGIETIKGQRSEEYINEYTESQFNKTINKVLDQRNLENKLILYIGIVNNSGSMIILGVGTFLTMKGSLSIGSLLSFYTLLGYFISPTFEVLKLQLQLQSSMAALDRLYEIDISPKENLDGIVPSDEIKTIEVKDLNFSYGYRDRVLEDISLNISKGDKIAVVGPSGCGKTTLVKLLMDYYKVDEGIININGYSIEKISKSWLRSKIVYISQSIFFFKATIRENLLLGNIYIDDREIKDYLKIVGLEDFLEKLPKGLDTIIEEDASNLSEGQKQRLAICRALLKKPEILILDEATSHLDSITEKKISDLFKDISDKITTITIAHRLSSIVDSDLIYFMDGGKIISKGSHKDLLRENEFYREMVNNLAISPI